MVIERSTVHLSTVLELFIKTSLKGDGWKVVALDDKRDIVVFTRVVLNKGKN